VPSVTKSGQMRSEGVSTVSATMALDQAEERLRRIRVEGKDATVMASA
jgi:hypothetical protein